jgi:hypothetical protein
MKPPKYKIPNKEIITLPKYKDEALLVAHLLGGRYGWEKNEDFDEEIPNEQIKEQVSTAIRVAREIRKQLAELEK